MTIEITDDYIVDRKSDLSFTDEAAFRFTAHHDASLFNFGTVTVNGTVSFGQALVGISSSGTDTYKNSEIINKHTASFIVAATSATGFAFGYYSGSWGPSFINKGHWEVTSPYDACGVQTNSPDTFFSNSGVFHVTAGHDATGVLVENRGDWANTGDIDVSGGNSAIAFRFFDVGNNTFKNTGSIVAHDESEVNQSTAILFAHSNALPVLKNTGLIEAEVAISETSPSGGLLRIENPGLIHGDIFLGDCVDVLRNTGEITGDVHLGLGEDEFDGIGGVLAGVLFGGLDSDVLTGTSGRDTIYGDDGVDSDRDGNDTLSGLGHADFLDGEGGNDRLIGGTGGDILHGGTGNDIFVYLSVRDTHNDLITDLTNEDTIDLSAVDADRTLSDDQAFTLVAALDGHPGQLALSFDSGTGVTSIFGDTNGDGVADLVIHLTGDLSAFTNFNL